MNKKGQEAGQALSTIVAFFIVVILLVVFYWIAGLGSLFSRASAASDYGFYAGPIGDVGLLSLVKPSEGFLTRPVVVRFEDGNIQLLSFYQIIALYRSDQLGLADLDRLIEKEPTQSGKNTLIQQRTLAYSHAVSSKIFNDVLNSFLLKQSDANTCLIVAQDIGRDLGGRLDSSSNENYDFFLKYDGTKVTQIVPSFVKEAYLDKLSNYHYSLSDRDVLVEYYYGPCLGGNA